MEVISFLNNKGGVTKSTSAMLFGELAALCGFTVVIIDADPQGTLSLDTYGLKRDTPGLSEILLNPESLEGSVHETRIQNLFVIPPGVELDKTALGYENAGELKKRTHRVIDAIREQLEGRVDLVIIDNPPRLEGVTSYTSSYSERVVLPTQTEEAAFKAVVRVYNEMQNNFEHWTKQRVYVFITKHNAKRNVSMAWLQLYNTWLNQERERHQKVHRVELAHGVLSTTIPDSADVENMKMEKASIFVKKSTSEVAKGYVAAFNEIYPEVQIHERLKRVLEERKVQNYEKNLKPNLFKKKQENVEVVA